MYIYSTYPHHVTAMTIIANTQSTSLTDIPDAAIRSLFPHRTEDNDKNDNEDDEVDGSDHEETNDFITDLARVGESQVVSSFSMVLFQSLTVRMIQGNNDDENKKESSISMCSIYGKAIKDMIHTEVVDAATICSHKGIGKIFKSKFLENKSNFNKKSEVYFLYRHLHLSLFMYVLACISMYKF